MVISEQSTRNKDKLSGIIQVLAAVGKWDDKDGTLPVLVLGV